MKTLYIADDGKEFEDEDECLEYERLHNEKTNKMLSEIHAFTERGYEIKVGIDPREYGIENMLMEAVYVTFDSEEALEFFDKQQEYYGYRPIHEYAGYKDGDVYIYKGVGEWESTMENIEHYQEILYKFAEGR